MSKRRVEILLGFAILVAAAVIIIITGRTPSRISYKAQLERAENVVRRRQDVALERFKIGGYDRFDWSQESRVIVFSSARTPKVVADVQFVGSYSDTSKTWLWAWANHSIEPVLVQDSLRVKAYGTERHFQQLTEAKWPATEADGWEMATFQAYVTGADVMYRTPFKGGKTYLTLKNIRWASPGARYPSIPSE